jgi:hypothetical protein
MMEEGKYMCGEEALRPSSCVIHCLDLHTVQTQYYMPLINLKYDKKFQSLRHAQEPRHF